MIIITGIPIAGTMPPAASPPGPIFSSVTFLVRDNRFPGGQGLNGDSQHFVVAGGDDSGGGRHARPQPGIDTAAFLFDVQGNHYLKVGGLLLCALPDDGSRVRYARHPAAEGGIGDSVNFDLHYVQDFNIHHVGLVHIHHHLHHGQVGDHQQDVGLESRSQGHFTNFLVELGHHTIVGRHQGGLVQVIPGLLQGSIGLFLGAQGRLEGRLQRFQVL